MWIAAGAGAPGTELNGREKLVITLFFFILNPSRKGLIPLQYPPIDFSFLLSTTRLVNCFTTIQIRM